MPYCRKCGIKLPDEEGAKFCPNCGTPIVLQPVRPELKRTLRVSRVRVSRSNRLKSLAIAIIACLVVTSFGTVLPIDPSEAQNLLGEIEGVEKALSSFGVALIFGNNLMHCLIMFTPFLGPFYGFYVLYSTGRFVAATASLHGSNPLALMAFMLIFPHAWLEYVSYGIAISESFWLSLMIVRHRFKAELNTAFKMISICAFLLLAAAFVETYLISLFI